MREQCSVKRQSNVYSNNVESNIESILQIFSSARTPHNIHKCHESDKKLTLCTFCTIYNVFYLPISVRVIFFLYLHRSYSDLLLTVVHFNLNHCAKNRMGKVKMSCHMQFSPHYIQRYFNTVKAKNGKKTPALYIVYWQRWQWRCGNGNDSTYKKWTVYRTSVVDYVYIHHFSCWICDLTFYRFVWIDTLCWHVYCLRSFDFSCLPFRPFYSNWHWLSSSKMHPLIFFLSLQSISYILCASRFTDWRSVMSMIECEIRRLWKKYLVSESAIEMEYDANDWTMVEKKN